MFVRDLLLSINAKPDKCKRASLTMFSPPCGVRFNENEVVVQLPDTDIVIHVEFHSGQGRESNVVDSLAP